MKQYNKFGAELIQKYEDYKKLSEKYGICIDEIIEIDFNRCGVYLPNCEVKEDFRVRFKGKVLNDYETWYALPVRAFDDTPFSIKSGHIYFYDLIIGSVKELMLDTCETSYQRGEHLLNLNSQSRSNCGGCKACIHSYHKLYDQTVIKDNSSLKTKEDLEKFFDSKKLDLSQLIQIAVVTGLFKNEQEVLEHMYLVHDVASKRGFRGELMYFGCQVNSKSVLEELSKLGNFSLIYAVDNFTKRQLLLSKTKSLITLEDAKNTLQLAKNLNIKTSISYISGIDGLEEMVKGFKFFKDSLTSFPIINIYQIQTLSQAKILDEKARILDYYIKSRLELEKIFKETEMRPKRWENYRPLWYKYFETEQMPNNTFGQLEKIKRR